MLQAAALNLQSLTQASRCKSVVLARLPALRNVENPREIDGQRFRFMDFNFSTDVVAG
jgi:hypothetical protein